MTVAAVLTGPDDGRLISFAAHIANGREDGLILFWLSRSSGETRIESSRKENRVPDEIRADCDELCKSTFYLARHKGDDNQKSATDQGKTKAALEVISIASSRVHVELERAIERLDIGCVVLPQDPQVRVAPAKVNLHEYLLEHVPCEIVVLSLGKNESVQCRRIVTPVGEGPHSASCLRMAKDIAKSCGSKLVALHVEPAIDDVSEQAAEALLTRTVDRALGGAQDLVEKRVVLADNVVEGIHQAIQEPTDLIILGMKRSGVVRRFSSKGVAEKLISSRPGPDIAVVQSAMPLSSWLGRGFEGLLQRTVPQLPRDQRVSLVDRIQSSSQWNVDFIALLCMSTIIASGGLIMDSAAVVIGAMLVAPLMTPLLGTGLSITQGNFVLFRNTLQTVFKGFLLAFVIGWLIGAVAAKEVTREMSARGNPRVLDIIVGMVGGIAAAYASGRPNLLSALPGVAIAAALVPPIATAGLATWLGDTSLAGRAALLFFTNIVAIVLGTWLTFRATGIRSAHAHGQYDRWSIGAGVSLMVLIVALGIFESMPPSPRGANVMQDRLNQLAEDDRWICRAVEYERVDGERVAHVFLESTQPLDEERLNRVREAVLKSHDQPIRVRFTTTTR